MFDFDKEEMMDETIAMDEFEWEEITKKHAEEGNGISADRIYSKVHKKHKERIGVAAARYALLAIGLTAIGWAVRDVSWLAITLGVIALVLGLIAAYGIGKYREM
jgi:hypothetical protein